MTTKPPRRDPEAPAHGAFVVESRVAEPLQLSVVIPTREEARSVGSLVREIDALLKPHLTRYEIVVVDDDSRDGTWHVALRAQDDLSSLRVLRRTHERGLATAVVRGWQAARGDVLAVLDGDLQHPPEVLVDLWHAIDGGADLAVASRHVQGGGVSDWSLRRRALSRAAQVVGLLLLPRVVSRVSDPMSGYFMLRRETIAGRELSPLGYKILVEVLARGDVRAIRECPYVFRERSEGGSKITLATHVHYIGHLARLRASRT